MNCLLHASWCDKTVLTSMRSSMKTLRVRGLSGTDRASSPLPPPPLPAPFPSPLPPPRTHNTHCSHLHEVINEEVAGAGVIQNWQSVLSSGHTGLCTGIVSSASMFSLSLSLSLCPNFSLSLSLILSLSCCMCMLRGPVGRLGHGLKPSSSK